VGCKVINISWQDIEDAASKLAARHSSLGHKAVYGIPTGGSVVAPYVAKYLRVPVVPDIYEATLIVDDMVDSGATFLTLLKGGKDFAVTGFGPPMLDALFRKPNSPKNMASQAIVQDGWLYFPWEKEAHPEDAVTRLLQYLGEDVTRQGLVETPKRVCKALREMTVGYSESPEKILGTVFEQDYDEVVICRGIPFTSLCEHHMLPFTGTADVGYLPGKVVGLSKLARLVDCFSRRLQMQERLTKQIADALMQYLEAKGAAVVVRGQHACMSCRGVRKPGADMVTSVMLGVFRDKPEARAEFLSLCSG
jgi:GTP cyclohydrolase I